MKRSTERILTTHTGSLPRLPTLTAALQRRDRGEGTNGELDTQVRAAVLDVVRRQAEAGVTVVSDGEVGKIGYSTYVKERLTGFGGESGPGAPNRDAIEFPEYVESVTRPPALTRPACIGPVSYPRSRGGAHRHC
jgi:5-methyltetrahydropteroyltriglutamate--homocysteine methyltransferase